MTADKDFKRLVRDRMAKTGESYSTARRAVMDGGDVKPRMVSLKPISQVVHTEPGFQIKPKPGA